MVVHKKTENEYRIVGLTKNCTNKNEGQILVLYESLTIYRDVHFSRELSEFLVKFECPDISDSVKTFKDLLEEFKKPENESRR